MRQRYWRIGQDSKVAEHGPDLPGVMTGPRLRVVVSERPIPNSTEPVDQQRSVSVFDTEGQPVLRLNHGSARWLGVRLIEAAALDEAAGYIVQDHEAEVAIDNLADWIGLHPEFESLPGETTAAHALRILDEYAKQIRKKKAAPPDPREQALAFVRDEAEKLLARPGTVAVRRFQEVAGQAIGSAGILRDEAVTDLTKWLGPQKVSELRGLGAL